MLSFILFKIASTTTKYKKFLFQYLSRSNLLNKHIIGFSNQY